VFKNGIRLRFETYGVVREGEVWTASWRCVMVTPEGVPRGDPYETSMELREAEDGTAATLGYTFYKGQTTGPRIWLERLIRPLTRMQGGWIVRSALEKSGGFRRYEEARGAAPRPATVVGVPMTRTSLVLFALGAASFMWMSGVWPGLALLMVLVLHELGHVLAMRAYGDRTSAFYLVPFLGGAAIGQKQLESDWRLVVMVLAGPFAGLLSALGALGLFHLTGVDWWVAVAFLAAVINLFNLLPIPVLDGGQVFMAVFRRYLPEAVTHWLGVGLMMAGAAGAAWIGSTLLMVIFGFMAAMQAAFPMPQSATGREPLSHAGAAATALLFVALGVALVGVLWLVVNGEAYPGNALQLLDGGPFAN
ncbi:MAG: metalloprotease, partial [Beijerinckiaceae bacterium]